MNEAEERNSTAIDGCLIQLAHEMVQANDAYLASYEPLTTTCEEEEAREAEQVRLWAIVEAHAERLAGMAPRTLAGAAAKARAAHALAVKDTQGELIAYDTAQLVVLAVIDDVIALAAERAA